MGLVVKLAWRNILRQKRRSTLTVLTMTGGFVLSSLSIGWMNGSYDNMILFFTGHRTGQVQIHGKGYLDDPDVYNTINDYSLLAAKLDTQESVEAWAPRIYSGGLIGAREDGAPAGLYSSSAGVFITAIDPEREEQATGFSSQLVSGSMLSASSLNTSLRETGRILLGKELSIVLDAGPGDSLVLFASALDGSAADRRYVVQGVVSTGNPELDRNTAWITLEDAFTLFAMEDRVHEIAVITGSLDGIPAAVAEIESALGDSTLAVDPWQVFAREFHNGMKADEVSLRITLGIILAMAALGVLNTVLMMVLERRREFGVMKALGTPPGRIVRMVVLEANLLALVSITAGAVLSTLGLLFLSRNGITLEQPLNYGGFIFREMMASFSPECYWVPALCILITASLVALLPALKASRTDPAGSLRTV